MIGFRLLIVGSLLLLSGCVGLNAEFECKQKPGVQCKSLAEVNQWIDTKQSNVNQQAFSMSMKVSTDSPKNTKKLILMAPNNFASNSFRTSESSLIIWIAPYTDKMDRYHTEHTVYTVIEKSHWVMEKI